MLPDLLTAEEIAPLFRVKPETVKRWARDGVIRSVRIPGVKRHMFRRDDVEQLLASDTHLEDAS